MRKYCINYAKILLSMNIIYIYLTADSKTQHPKKHLIMKKLPISKGAPPTLFLTKANNFIAIKKQKTKIP